MMKTEDMAKDKAKTIVLFDGVCNLCQTSVQFIIRRDPKAIFHFAAFQSAFGKDIQKIHNLSEKIESLILIEKEQMFYKSTAALRIAKNLNGLWPIFYIFIIIPKPIRDFFYDLIAINRYKIFGKTAECMIPEKKYLERFI